MTGTFSTNEDNIVPFPETEQDSRIQEQLVGTILAAIRVLNARLLCILALVGAMAMWAVAMVDPTEMRIACGVGYSLLVLLPVLATYAKKS